jgi:hypothetical protein
VQALSDDGLIGDKEKIKDAVKKEIDWNAGWGPGTGALGADGGNTIRTVNDGYFGGGNHAPAIHTKTLSARDRRDARTQYEHLSLQYPGLLPHFDASRLSSVEFGLTRRNDAGERVFQNSVPFAFDPLKAISVRSLMRRELHMGNGHCFIRLDVGDVDALGRPVPLLRFVETEAEVDAFCDNTRLSTEILSSGKKKRVQATMPMVYCERVIIPSGGMNAKGQMTGDPIDPTNNKPLSGGIWIQSSNSFSHAESSAVVGAKNPTKLQSLKLENDVLNMYIDKPTMDATMQAFRVVYAETRMQMVANLMRNLRAEFPEATEKDARAEPAIAFHDAGWDMLLRLQVHANCFYNLFETTKKLESPFKSPFGQNGMLAGLMRKVWRIYTRVDQDVDAISSCTSRRSAAMMVRLSALTRIVEHMDDNNDNHYDIRAAMRGTKSGATLPVAAAVQAQLPAAVKTAPPAPSAAKERSSSSPAVSPVPAISARLSKKARALKARAEKPSALSRELSTKGVAAGASSSASGVK